MIPVTPPEGIPISRILLPASHARTTTPSAEPPIPILVEAPGTNVPTRVVTVRDPQVFGIRVG